MSDEVYARRTPRGRKGHLTDSLVGNQALCGVEVIAPIDSWTTELCRKCERIARKRDLLETGGER